MKTLKLIRLIVYHILIIAFVSCSDDENSPNDIPLLTPLSFNQGHYSIAGDADSLSISIKFGSKAANNGFVAIALTGDLVYDQDYATDPQAEDAKIILDLVKGVQSASVKVYRKNFNLEEEKSLNIRLSSPTNGFVLGGQVTATITFGMNEVSVSEVNFSDEKETLSEDKIEGAEIALDFSSSTRKSENLKIVMDYPSTIEYGTHFYTVPAAVLNEISLDILPQAEYVNFKIIPVNDQILIGNYEIKFTLGSITDGLKIGTRNEFIATIEENDNPTGTTQTILSVKENFENHQGDWFFPSDYYIEGVITSKDNVLDNKTAYIQDATAGILIRFNTPSTLKLGDKIRLNLIHGSGKIINYQKSVDGLRLENSIRHNENLVVEAEKISLDQLYSGNFEGKRVTIENVEFREANGVLTFVGNRSISQGSAVAYVLTYPTAAFSDFILPGGKVTVSGIVGDWGRLMPQLYTHDIIK